jgi:hypothetical protein
MDVYNIFLYHIDWELYHLKWDITLEESNACFSLKVLLIFCYFIIHQVLKEKAPAILELMLKNTQELNNYKDKGIVQIDTIWGTLHYSWSD